MINERDARYDLRMRSQPNDWLAIGLCVVAFLLAMLPVTVMTFLQ